MLFFYRRFLFLLLFVSNISFGFSISPMLLDMEPSGSKARSSVVVSNSSPKPMPVKANISELTLDINGKTRSVLNTTDFVIFPQQAILPPHGQQTFRVQWRNQPVLPTSKTYELVVAQVAAKDHRPKEKTNGTSISLDITLAFGSVINMHASGGSPKPVVRSSKLSRNKAGKPMLETVITNNGNQSFLLAEADSTVIVMGLGNQKLWSHTYLSGQMLKNFGLGMVQPNKSRRMTIPLPNLPDNIARQAKSIKLEIRPSAK